MSEATLKDLAGCSMHMVVLGNIMLYWISCLHDIPAEMKLSKFRVGFTRIFDFDGGDSEGEEFMVLSLEPQGPSSSSSMRPQGVPAPLPAQDSQPIDVDEPEAETQAETSQETEDECCME